MTLAQISQHANALECLRSHPAEFTFVIAAVAAVFFVSGLAWARYKQLAEIPSQAPAKSGEIKTAPGPSGSGEMAGLSSETVVILAAAVEASLGRGHRISSIEQVEPASAALLGWSVEGRRQIFSSHHVR